MAKKTPRKTSNFLDGDDLKQVIYFALFCIFFLETIALLKGVDGIMFGAATAGIGALGGYTLKAYQSKKK